MDNKMKKALVLVSLLSVTVLGGCVNKDSELVESYQNECNRQDDKEYRKAMKPNAVYSTDISNIEIITINDYCREFLYNGQFLFRSHSSGCSIDRQILQISFDGVDDEPMDIRNDSEKLKSRYSVPVEKAVMLKKWAVYHIENNETYTLDELKEYIENNVN